ncbi:MAG: hypothetical protein ACRCZP_12190, partial [Phycicoccus sp.]
GMTRWTDLWRLLGRLPLVFSSGRGPDPLAAAKDAVREAAKSGRPASGILNIRYEKPDGASQALPWHTVVISSHDGVSVTLEDPDKGVELTDEAIRTGAAHSHVVAAQRGGPVQETGPQRFSIDLLFTHDEPGAPLAGLPDTVVQGWATTTGDTTTVLLDVRERPTLDALGVPYLFADAQGRTYDPGSDPDPDPPAFVAVTHRLPSAPPLGRDGRVWIEYDKANPSTPVRIVPQRTDDRVDLTWAQATAPPSEAPSGSGAVASSGTPADVPDTGDSFGVPEHLLRSRLAKVRSALIVDPQVFVDPLSRALAVDRLRAGGSTDAVPGSIVDLPELERLLRRPGEHFDDIGDLAAHVAALGHGARGIAEIEYRELGRRHAVVVENVLGRVVFLQDGAVLTPGPDRLSDRRGPRALTTGLVVAPELLDGPTEASALPELSDVSYRFVRSDDAIVAGTSPGGVVTVDDRSGREAAVLEFLEGVGPWLGDMAVPEDELLEVLGSDAVVLVAGPSGAVRGLARAVLVVGEDGSTTGRVGSMLVDPRYRDGGVVERELSRGMERRLAGLGADRIEWPVVRPQGSEPATSVFHEPRYARLVGSSASGAPVEVGPGHSSGKSLRMTVGDAASIAFGRMGDLGDAVFGQTFASLDAGVLRPVEESGPVQWLGGTPVVQVTGDGLSALADVYRAVGRFAQNNPATNRTLGWYQALVRQMRYFPAHLLAEKAYRDQVRTLERAFDFYDSARRRTEALVTEAESLAAEIERQRSRRVEAERLGDRISVEDADRQGRPLVWRLGELMAGAAAPLVELGRRATTQIGRGESMLRRQERAAAVRRAELDQALRDDHGVQTPRVLTARARAVEAAAPFDLAAAVAQARAQYQALEAGAGQDRDAEEYVAAVEQARVVYELAKADLAKFTLAGNDAVLGLILDRDEGLPSQLDRLRRLRERSGELVEGLRHGRGASSDAADQARSAVERLREVRAELDAAREVAAQRRDRMLRAPVVVQAGARADQLSVDTRAAGSQLTSELGQIGFLHSQAKDIVDGKGKGRIDVLSNAANIEDAARQVALVRAEVAQWQARVVGLTDQIAALTGSVPDPPTAAGDPTATLLALVDAREAAARRLTGADRRLETRERRLSLEQRAAEPRSIRVRVADLRAKVDTSADLVRRIQATHARRQARLAEQIERAGRAAAAAVDPARQHRLREREQRLRAVREANDYALQRAV